MFWYKSSPTKSPNDKLNRTNREASLSERGIEQVEETCRRLKEQGIQPTILRYSLAAAAIDTADILGKELKVSSGCLWIIHC